MSLGVQAMREEIVDPLVEYDDDADDPQKPLKF